MAVHADPLQADDTGEVKVLVRYLIDPADEPEFRRLLAAVRRWRLRTGAHAWSLYRDFDRPHQWIESFVVSSWVEHLRQHGRTTEDDWASQQAVYRLHRGDNPPEITHLIAPRSDGSIPTRDDEYLPNAHALPDAEPGQGRHRSPP